MGVQTILERHGHVDQIDVPLEVDITVGDDACTLPLVRLDLLGVAHDTEDGLTEGRSLAVGVEFGSKVVAILPIAVILLGRFALPCY